jgi:carbon storage regulator CsrA
MLILRRKLNEAIVINENVTVTVLAIEINGREISGGQVKFSIAAPDSVKIRRSELEAQAKGTS